MGLDDAMHAVADSTRRAMLQRLAHGPATVGQLAALFPISRPAVSQHLRVLRDAGLVDVRVDAQRRLYRVRPDPLQAIDEWLAPYREMWSERLDDLERHLETMDEETT